MKIVPYVVFTLIYAGLLFLAAFLLDALGAGQAGEVLLWLTPFAFAPFALLAASRLGALTSAGVALTSFVLVLGILAAIDFILLAIAVPVRGQPSLAYVAQSFVRLFQLGGWLLLLNALILVVAPWLWSLRLLSRNGSHATQEAA